MPLPTGQPIIITGMHRSGTSLAASLLQSMGVDIGDELVGAMRGNIHGHFEDVRFMEFQEQLMHRQGAHWGVRDDGTAAPLVVTEADIAVASDLIQQNATKATWGWKDPRTSILLPLWGRLLPDARFLFVFRHPAEVVSSLLRRGQDGRLTDTVWPAFRAWAAYNASILRFVAEGPKFWLIANIDAVLERLGELPGLFEAYLDTPGLLPPDPGLIDQNEFHRLPRSAVERIEGILERVEPDVLFVHRELACRAQERGLDELISRADHPPASQDDSADRAALAQQVRDLLLA